MLKLVLIAVMAASGMSFDAFKLPVESPGCGESHTDGVGWTITDSNEDFGCDGSLIDPWVVMTSASCILGHPATKLEVRGPKWDPDTKTMVLSDKHRSVVNIINHYNFNAQSGTSDLTLLILTEAVVIDDYVNTVCLPTSKIIFDRSQCFVSKFEKNIFAEGHRSPKILKHSELLIATPNGCLGAIGPINHEKNSLIMTRKVICAGSENITEGFEGDVGGPMICPVLGERGRYVQAGIVSSILSRHREKKPALYTNVAPMWDWINEAMAAMRMDNSHYTYQPRIHDSTKKLYIITPSYKRSGQIAFLTKLSQTLMFIPNMHWLVIEDAEVPTAKVTDFLKKTGLKFEHLTGKTPTEYPHSSQVNRHVSIINQGLDWLRQHTKEGVFYFALEDCIHSIELFEEIRKTKKVSIFPVGFGSSYGLSSPVLRNGIFDGYYESYMANRNYPVDFSGFAVNVEFLLKRPNAKMPFPAGYRGDGFIKSLEPLGMNEVDFLADKCTKILVWNILGPHVHELVDVHKYRGTNIEELAKQF